MLTLENKKWFQMNYPSFYFKKLEKVTTFIRRSEGIKIRTEINGLNIRKTREEINETKS